MRSQLSLFLVVGLLLGGCSPTIKLPTSYVNSFTGGGGGTTTPPTTVAPTAGYAVTSGGRIATHPNAVLMGSIGKVGRPIVQTNASVKSASGLTGALYVP